MTLGQIAYQAYCGSVGLDLASWHRLPKESQIAWQKAAVAVVTFRATPVRSSDLFFGAGVQLPGQLCGQGNKQGGM